MSNSACDALVRALLSDDGLNIDSPPQDYLQMSKSSNSSDSQIVEADSTASYIAKLQNRAIMRPRQIGYKKPLQMLRGYEPLESLPVFLSPKHAPDNRWPPVLFYGIHVPTSRIVDHWEKGMLPHIDRSKHEEEVFKTSEKFPVPDNFFVSVIFDLERTLSQAVGWRISVLEVHGLPGDHYARVARLCDNYYSTRIPNDVVRKLRDTLGTQSPPMWYLTTGGHAQWDSFPGHNRKSRPRMPKRSQN